VSFSEDLESLARCDKFRSLNKKIAVIYLDGNRFGAIQRDLVTSPDQQLNFDRGIRSARAGLMVGLLDALIDENVDGKQGCVRLRETSFLPASDRVERALRFETLLWGGDEMTLVAPAWLGFALIQLFYRLTADWKRNERLSRILTRKESLTHAGGIVFCHAKTPPSPYAAASATACGGRQGERGWNKLRVRVADDMIGNIFGSTDAAALLYLDDARGPYAEKDVHRQFFNAVDRFTGGVLEHRLYNVRAVFPKELAWKLNRPEAPEPLTETAFCRLEESPDRCPNWMRKEIPRLANRYRFFHWHLQFPDVFHLPAGTAAPSNPQTGW
jgi:hypothetical protein